MAPGCGRKERRPAPRACSRALSRHLTRASVGSRDFTVTLARFRGRFPLAAAFALGLFRKLACWIHHASESSFVTYSPALHFLIWRSPQT